MNYLILPLEELEQLCNLPKRYINYDGAMHPTADACLGQQLTHDNTLKTVTSISFEFEPGKVRATLR